MKEFEAHSRADAPRCRPLADKPMRAGRVALPDVLWSGSGEQRAAQMSRLVQLNIA